MHGSKYRLIGLTFLTGAALATGCGGDDGGGGGSGNNNATNTTGTNVTSNVTNNVNTATSNGTTGAASTAGSGTTGAGTGTTGTTVGTGTTGAGTGTTGAGTTSGTSVGTGTTGSTSGSGGSGGGGCEDDPPLGTTTGGAGEGGAAGASGEELSEGWNFEDEAELGEWSIVACAEDATDCVDDASASIDFSCGVLQVEIDWPAAANTAAARFQIQNVVPETMLRDLTGKVLYARVRMTSASAVDHGYDFDVIAQDYVDDDDDSNDWKWFATCYNGSGSCPDNPTGETYTTDAWVPLTLPMSADLAPAEFAFDGIRKFAVQIATKHWDGPEFAYDDAPTTFEIDYVAW